MFVPKIKKLVTLPQLKLLEGGKVYIKPEAAMVKEADKVRKDKDGNEVIETGPFTMRVTNLETGELMQIVVPAVLHGVLCDNYVGDSYVGKGFQVEVCKKVAGKKYREIKVAELELD